MTERKIKLYSKDWADHKLSFTVKYLQGKYDICQWKGRVHLALIIKEELLEHGFVWHAERVGNWIHRLAPKSDLYKGAIDCSHQADSPWGEGERAPSSSGTEGS